MLGEQEYNVLWPLGPAKIDHVEATAGLSDFNGKRVAFIWDYLFRGREMFAEIERELTRIAPAVEFVSDIEFGNIHGTDAEERAALQALPARLKALRVDAAVVGVGA